MRISWSFLSLALMGAGASLTAGCGGIRASKTISPLDFLLPGIIRAEPPQTNVPTVLLTRNAIEVASSR